MGSGMKKFDHIISLGWNCEPSFQMKLHLGFVESFPFSWCGIYDHEVLLKVLNNKNIIFSGDIQEFPNVNMWLCKTANITFHAQRKAKDFIKFTGEELKQEKKKELEDLKNKINYLFTKLENIWASEKKQLYILTINKDNKNFLEFIKDLDNLLRDKTKNYSLLIILSKEQYSDSYKDNDHIFFRYINNFSPNNKVTDLNYCDLEGWKNIFNEFKPNVIKKNNKKFKFTESSNIFKIIYYHTIILFFKLIYILSLEKSKKIKNKILKYSFKLKLMQ